MEAVSKNLKGPHLQHTGPVLFIIGGFFHTNSVVIIPRDLSQGFSVLSQVSCKLSELTTLRSMGDILTASCIRKAARSPEEMQN